jgi:hypothetical protein
MKLKILLFCILFSNFIFSSNGKYRLVLTDDPSTTIMIGWEQVSGTNPEIYYGTSDFGTNFSSYPNSKTVDRTVSYKGMNNSFSKLVGLLPNTNYYFVIKDSEGTSQRFWFRTAPDTNDTMSFISGGDSRNNRGPRQDANLLVSKLKPTAVFFGGDMTNGDSNGEWQDWFEDWQLTIATDGRMFPIVPTRGNHESSNNSIFELFNVPSTNIYYKLTFGANLYSIYTLNSEITAGGSQYSWLQAELSVDNAIWKSAQYHKPMRPHVSDKSEGNDEYASWAQLFYDEEVRLVYESDSHTVKTTWPVKPCQSGANCEEGFERENQNGTTYVGEGCWGAPLRNSNDTKIWTRDSGSFNQFKWVCVSQNQIEIKTIEIVNVSNVSENPNNSVCQLPNNLNIWNPSSGNTVSIVDSSLEVPSISITSHSDNEYLPDGNNIMIAVSAHDNDGYIDYVEFIIDNTLVHTDYSAPFEMYHSFTDGSHDVETKAYDDDGLRSNDFINILTGTYSDAVDIIVSEDVEQNGNNGDMYTDSSDLELVYDGAKGFQTIGLRFANLPIPPNAVINNAYVQFTADGSFSNAVSYKISIEDTDNASPFNNLDYDVTNRVYLNSINWSPPQWNSGDAGVNQRTPNLNTEIQDIINSSNWLPNNAVVLKIEASGASSNDPDSKRRAESSEGSAAPVLHIEYTIVPGVLNVDVQQEKVSLKLYPNPVKDILYLNLPDSAKWFMQIFNISGFLIYENSILDNKIDLQNIKEGLYFIKIIDEKGRDYSTQKIIKK